MFLNENHISRTFIREDDRSGHNETVLVIEMDDTPDKLKETDPKGYDRLSQKLSYLDNLAQNGFLDFDRIEVISDTKH